VGLRDSLIRFGERFRLASQRLGQRVQQVVVTTLLFFVYLVGVGATRLAAVVFARRFLKLYTADSTLESYWIEAEGYNPDPDNLLKQI